MTSRSNGKMHVGELDIDVPLVRRLLAVQFPQWAGLPIEPVRSSGTDNAIYRLGAEMLVRLPRIDWAVGQVQKEQEWLPKLAPLLRIAIPAPLALGMPCEWYPWNWSVYGWLDGEVATMENLADPKQFAIELAEFIESLRQIDTAGGPVSGSHNSSRGVPLATRDATVRASLASLHGIIDTELALKAWEVALRTSVWHGAPVWIHGDLQAGNLLTGKGRLSAVIDFGCLGVGDPACDLIVAWNLLSAETREVFRTTLAMDDLTWARGKGWALSIGLIALPYYLHTNTL